MLYTVFPIAHLYIDVYKFFFDYHRLLELSLVSRFKSNSPVLLRLYGFPDWTFNENWCVPMFVQYNKTDLKKIKFKGGLRPFALGCYLKI